MIILMAKMNRTIHNNSTSNIMICRFASKFYIICTFWAVTIITLHTKYADLLLLKHLKLEKICSTFWSYRQLIGSHKTVDGSTAFIAQEEYIKIISFICNGKWWFKYRLMSDRHQRLNRNRYDFSSSRNRYRKNAFSIWNPKRWQLVKWQILFKLV